MSAPPRFWIPAASLVICGEDHAYDAAYDACPCCGGSDRIFVVEAFKRHAEGAARTLEKVEQLAALVKELKP